MLLNGSIRRKMWINLAIVVGMLTALSVGALTGLNSYRRLVRELDYSIHDAPRRSELTDAVKSLYAPLIEPVPNHTDIKARGKVAGAQCRRFEERLTDTKHRFLDFHRRFDMLDADAISAEQRTKTAGVLQKMESLLESIETNARNISDASEREAHVTTVLRQVRQLEKLSHQVPDFQSGLHDSLARAKGIYLSRIRLVGWMSAIVFLTFIGFGYYVYAGILSPIRELHQGATRVADGDFRYQLDLPDRGELTELANAFNRMTRRFEEVQSDLSDEVSKQTRQAMRSARLANIGFLAAGVAHEINNPLSAISMAAEALDRESAADSDDDSPEAKVRKKYQGMIRRESARCQQITKRLLNFAGGDDGERTNVNLTHLINEVLDMVRPMNKYADRTIEFFRTEPLVAEVNGPEIKQVVLNLVSNGLESMEADGVLRIRTTEQTDFVQLIFEDNGCGMSDEVLENLFEPFFTRRKDGRGTGLGMAICQRIVDDHDGTLEAESAGEDAGSTFRLKLPRRARQTRDAA